MRKNINSIKTSLRWWIKDRLLKPNSFPTSLTPISFSVDTSSKAKSRRLNLLIPNIERGLMYGGQKTALNFFTELLKHFDGDARLLVDCHYSSAQLNQICSQYPDWDITPLGSQSDSPRQITCIDGGNRDKVLPIREHDYFVYTHWRAAYAFAGYTAFQQQSFARSTPHIHLIQDFEPGFNAWSTDYMLADSVYHQQRTIAVFNSVELRDWFNLLGYQFESSYVFSPKLDPQIAAHINDSTGKRENLLIFYGRPNVPRNCFTLILHALNLLLAQHPEVEREWTILSIGSDIGSVKLVNGQRLKTTGKMTLDEYAALMHRARIGVSLMCSPHPSYPPLEMAAFGIRTITNSFVTKDLGDVPNITTLNSLTFQKLADAIWQEMNNEASQQNASVQAWPQRYATYLKYDDFFDGIIQPIADEISTDAN